MIGSDKFLVEHTSLAYFVNNEENADFEIPQDLMRDLMVCVADRNAEMWQALIREFGDRNEPQRHIKEKQSSSSLETVPPLPKLPPGPWRSLGGYFDYSTWQDRERFRELDRALASGRNRPEPEEDDEEFPTAA